jgi:hypothetical protein
MRRRTACPGAAVGEEDVMGEAVAWLLLVFLMAAGGGLFGLMMWLGERVRAGTRATRRSLKIGGSVAKPFHQFIFS